MTGYIYYIVYNLYNKDNQLIGDGKGDVNMKVPITDFEHIKLIEQWVIEQYAKKTPNVSVNRVNIIFYQLLREEIAVEPTQIS